MRYTYTVRVVVDHGDTSSSFLGENDFTLTHPYEGVEVVASSITSVRRWLDGATIENEDISDVCLNCFGNLTDPTGSGYPLETGNCHRAFPVSPMQGVLA